MVGLSDLQIGWNITLISTAAYCLCSLWQSMYYFVVIINIWSTCRYVPHIYTCLLHSSARRPGSYLFQRSVGGGPLFEGGYYNLSSVVVSSSRRGFTKLHILLERCYPPLLILSRRIFLPAICGHHVYTSMWQPFIEREILTTDLS